MNRMPVVLVTLGLSFANTAHSKWVGIDIKLCYEFYRRTCEVDTHRAGSIDQCAAEEHNSLEANTWQLSQDEFKDRVKWQQEAASDSMSATDEVLYRPLLRERAKAYQCYYDHKFGAKRKSDKSVSPNEQVSEPHLSEQSGYSEIQTIPGQRLTSKQASSRIPPPLTAEIWTELLEDRKRTKVLDTQNLSICLRVDNDGAGPMAVNDCNKTISYEYCWTKTTGDTIVACEENRYAGWILKPFASSRMIVPKRTQGSKIYWATCAYPGIVSDKRWSPAGISFSCR